MAEPEDSRLMSPLQLFVARALDEAPRARGFYDGLIQKATGTKGKPLYDIQRGKTSTPGLAMLKAVADALGQPIELLIDAANGKPVRPVPVGAEPPVEAPIGPAPADGTVTIKQVDLSFGMGPGKDLDEYAESTPVELDAALIRSITRSPAENLIIVRGDGDSMTPTLINEDMVLVDTAQKALNLQDRIWAVSFDGAGMIKRLRKLGGGRIEVISDNPMIGNQDVAAEELFIVGRVIWVGRRV